MVDEVRLWSQFLGCAAIIVIAAQPAIPLW